MPAQIDRHSKDFELAQAVASGDQSAFNDLYFACSSQINRVIRHFIREESDAEDIAQEFFLRLTKRIARYKGSSKLSTWLHRVAVNECFMFFRKIKKSRFVVEIDAPEFNEDSLPGRVHETPDLRLDLEKAISRLADGYNKVFYLRHVEGYEHRELAARFDISQGTSRSQDHKARLKMQKLLNRRINPKVYQPDAR